MKGLHRLARPTSDDLASQPLVDRPPARQDDLYLPLDPGDMSAVPPPDEARSRGGRRPRGCCFDTNGRAFNFVAGVVVLASSLVVGLEADLGLLGPGAAMHWGSLESELGQLNVPPEEAKLLRAEMLDGVAQDQALQVRLRGEATKDLDRVGVHDFSIPDIPEPLAPAAYTVCEYAFVAFFTIELLLRMCDQRRAFFESPWSGLDAVVVAQGLLDVSLPLACGPDPSPQMLDAMSVLRIMRVLRVARLLRVSLALRMIARAFANAFSAMAWIGAVVLILNFVLAILLTVLVGQHATVWDANSDDVSGWFGSIGASMQTLFKVMTLSGWDEIAAVLSEVLPPAVVSMAFFTYLLASFFTVLSLATGVVTDFFMTARQGEEAFQRIQLEEHRTAFASALVSVLSSCTQSNKGYMCRDEYLAALEGHPVLLSKLRRIDIHTSADELLQLFDRVGQESDREGSVKIEVLAEAMTNLSGAARSSSVLDVKYVLQAMRKEVTDQAAEALAEAARRHEEVAGQLAASREAADALREAAEAARREAAAARHAASSCAERLSSAASVAAVAQRVEELGRRMAAAEGRSSESFEAVNRSLASFSAQALSQLAALGAKVAELSAAAGAAAPPEAPAAGSGAPAAPPLQEARAPSEEQRPAEDCADGAPQQGPGQPLQAPAASSGLAAAAAAAAPEEAEGDPGAAAAAREAEAAAGAEPAGEAAAAAWEAAAEPAGEAAPAAVVAREAAAEPAGEAAPAVDAAWEASFPVEAVPGNPGLLRAPSEPEGTPPGRGAELADLLEAEPPEVATPLPGDAAVGSPGQPSRPPRATAGARPAASPAAAAPERRGGSERQEVKHMMDLSASEIFDKLVKQDAGDTFS